MSPSDLSHSPRDELAKSFRKLHLTGGNAHALSDSEDGDDDDVDDSPCLLACRIHPCYVRISPIHREWQTRLRHDASIKPKPYLQLHMVRMF